MNILTFLLTLQAQLRLLHWQTSSYARHVAYGQTYDKISELADDLVETYQGRNGKLPAVGSLDVKNINEDGLDAFVATSIHYLEGLETSLGDVRPDVGNIRDEMVATLNKLRYLLTLK